MDVLYITYYGTGKRVIQIKGLCVAAFFGAFFPGHLNKKRKTLRKENSSG